MFKGKFLKFLVLLLVVVMFASLYIFGCKKDVATTAAEVEAEQPVTFRIVAFQGAWEDSFLQEPIRILQENHPNLTVDLIYDPESMKKMQPMFVSGDPPDVCTAGWGFDLWGAVAEGQIKPLDEILQSNAIDKDVPFIETFSEDAFRMAKSNDGKIMYLPEFMSNYGWWYNKTIWDEHGWEPPKTWEEAYILFDKMKTAGVAPISHCGSWGGIYIRYHYLPEFIARLAGPRKLEACWNLEPNSWTDSGVIESLSFIKKLSDNYLQEGYEGMNHLQAQAEVMVGNAGLTSCGDWFPIEEREVWEEGVEVRSTPLPPFPESKYPQNVYVRDNDSGTLWVIPAKSAHEELAVEFLKIMFSEEVQKKIVEDNGLATVYKGSEEWVPDNKFGRAALSVLEYYKDALYTIPEMEVFDVWYPGVGIVISDNIAAMMAGEATPQEVGEAIQKACDDVKNDPNSIIHEFSLGLDNYDY